MARTTIRGPQATRTAPACACTRGDHRDPTLVPAVKGGSLSVACACLCRGGGTAPAVPGGACLLANPASAEAAVATPTRLRRGRRDQAPGRARNTHCTSGRPCAHRATTPTCPLHAQDACFAEMAGASNHSWQQMADDAGATHSRHQLKDLGIRVDDSQAEALEQRLVAKDSTSRGATPAVTDTDASTTGVTSIGFGGMASRLAEGTHGAAGALSVAAAGAGAEDSNMSGVSDDAVSAGAAEARTMIVCYCCGCVVAVASCGVLWPPVTHRGTCLPDVVAPRVASRCRLPWLPCRSPATRHPRVRHRRRQLLVQQEAQRRPASASAKASRR